MRLFHSVFAIFLSACAYQIEHRSSMPLDWPAVQNGDRECRYLTGSYVDVGTPSPSNEEGRSPELLSFVFETYANRAIDLSARKVTLSMVTPSTLRVSLYDANGNAGEKNVTIDGQFQCKDGVLIQTVKSKGNTEGASYDLELTFTIWRAMDGALVLQKIGRESGSSLFVPFSSYREEWFRFNRVPQ